MIEVLKTATFDKWLAGLRDQTAVALIARRLERVQEGNLGDAKSVGGGVAELRIAYGPGYRVYFIRRGQVVIVLLCGGDKSSQQRDIARAKQMAVELKG